MSTVNKQNFAQFARYLFQYQVGNNPVYRSFIENLNIEPEGITSVEQIPFMPIGFFKRHLIATGRWQPVTCYTSSGTTGNQVSRHYVADEEVYLKNCLRIFKSFYGDPGSFHIFSLLPSYAEREGSSLIRMVEYLQRYSGSDLGGSYLSDFDALLKQIELARKRKDRKTLLLGVSFALLELGETCATDLYDVIIMETGGMKGRREELTRPELHRKLCHYFKSDTIHSEYGMTELFSQAYSFGNGLFHLPDTMQIIFRDPYDALDTSPKPAGAINIIDLANVHSCAFIATDDLGRKQDNGFEVIGRMDHSDVRGCNLLAV